MLPRRGGLGPSWAPKPQGCRRQGHKLPKVADENLVRTSAENRRHAGLMAELVPAVRNDFMESKGVCRLITSAMVFSRSGPVKRRSHKRTTAWVGRLLCQPIAAKK